MKEAQNFPYETRLNILYEPLQVIDEKALTDACTYKWYNQTLCQVNGSVVRLGVIEGEYHWHKHDEDYEFFYVVEGQLLIDLEGRIAAKVEHARAPSAVNRVAALLQPRSDAGVIGARGVDDLDRQLSVSDFNAP